MAFRRALCNTSTKCIRSSAFVQPPSKKCFATEATFQIQECKLHRLDTSPSTSVTVTKDDAMSYLRKMSVIRRMETAAGTMYGEKLIRGFLHLYAGQEAVAVGMSAILRAHDAVITAYRCHGWTQVLGTSVVGVLAELTGRVTGCSHGKGGSMHMYGPNFYGGNGIVGAQVPLGVGLGFAAKYKGTDGVSVVLYGDGAANQGQLYEVYNMACLWKLPVIFVCENNQYGMGTSAQRASASTLFYTRGDYLPGMLVDGMDVLATREATRFAMERCKEGVGPLLIEMSTYRYYGHSMSDPGTSYRSREEVQGVRKTRDPITMFKEKIISSGLATEDEIAALEKEVKSEVDEAVARSRTDKEPPLSETASDVYAKWDQPLRFRLPDNMVKHENVGKLFKPID